MRIETSSMNISIAKITHK